MRVVRSIRSIIFFRFFLVVALFFGVVSGVAYFVTKKTIRQFAISDNSIALSSVINNIRSNYTTQLAALDRIAWMSGFFPYEPARADIVLREFLEFQNVFTTVHFYRKDGKLLIAKKRDRMPEYNLEQNFYNKNNPEYIALAERVIREKRPITSQTFFTSRGDLYQTYLVPVFSDAQKTNVLGILSGGVFPRVQRIDSLVEGLRLNDKNFILVSDSRGRPIASSGLEENDVGRYLREPVDRAVENFYGRLAGPPDRPLVEEGASVRSLPFFLITLPLPELKLFVTLGVDTSLLRRKEKDLLDQLMAALVFGLILSSFASFYVGERLAKPFRAIVTAIKEISVGNFSARVAYQGDDEIGSLAELIQRLAEKIKKSDYLGNLWSTDREIRDLLHRKSTGNRDE